MVEVVGIFLGDPPGALTQPCACGLQRRHARRGGRRPRGRRPWTAGARGCRWRWAWRRCARVTEDGLVLGAVRRRRHLGCVPRHGVPRLVGGGTQSHAGRQGQGGEEEAEPDAAQHHRLAPPCLRPCVEARMPLVVVVEMCHTMSRFRTHNAPPGTVARPRCLRRLTPHHD